jgi:hypothetical protein
VGTSKASKAKQFLVDQVQRQAQHEGITLSDLEITMLGFSEAGVSSRELEAARQFESEIDDREYEAKIADLLKHGYRDAKAMGEAEVWDEALADLAEKDAYLMVIAERAGIWNSSPFASFMDWRFFIGAIPILCFVAAAVVVGITPLGARIVPNILLRCALFFLLLIAPWVIGKMSERKDED